MAGQEQPGLEELTLIPVLRLHGAPSDKASEGDHSAAEVDGFNLHASPPISAENRVALERLCRYSLRGPLALGRLIEGRRGQLLYRLKSPRRDGLSHLGLSPMALLQRLSWLVPLPRMHLTRYHGVLAPNHKWRRLVVKAPRPKPTPGQRCSPSRWIDWATLLRRVFLLEVLVCSTCGGVRRPVQVVKEGPIARKILEYLGLPTTTPAVAPYRPEPELWDWNFVPLLGTEPPVDLDQRSPDFDWDQRTASSEAC